MALICESLSSRQLNSDKTALSLLTFRSPPARRCPPFYSPSFTSPVRNVSSISVLPCSTFGSSQSVTPQQTAFALTPTFPRLWVTLTSVCPCFTRAEVTGGDTLCFSNLDYENSSSSNTCASLRFSHLHRFFLLNRHFSHSHSVSGFPTSSLAKGFREHLLF